MQGVNRVILIGNLGRDPELSYIGDKAKCKFSLATTERYGNGAERQDRTEWHNIVVWDKLAETIQKYLRKGRLIYLEGRIQSRDYQDKDNVKKYITEIIAQKITFLNGESENNRTQNDSPNVNNSMPNNTNVNVSSDFVDDIPF